MTTIMDAKLKEIVWKLDRDIWAKVETHEATQSWGREQSAKLILEYFGDIEELRKESLLRQQIIDNQRKVLSDNYNELQELNGQLQIVWKRACEAMKDVFRETHKDSLFEIGMINATPNPTYEKENTRR